jgi:hypothetical protein
MVEPKITIEWGGALLLLGGVIGGAFLVSWLLTDVLHVRRAPYVGALSLVAGGLTAGYVVWSGSGTAFWIERWPWGLLGAVLAGTFLTLMISRQPAVQEIGGTSAVTSIWEGMIYGSAEGLLLSVLPVAVTWQMFHTLGWTGGWSGVVAGSAAVAASVVVIVVHHLGYGEYRGRAILSPLVGCTVLSIAYLLTANPIAAMGGHIILHLAMLRRGMELPPHAGVGLIPMAEIDEESTHAEEMPVGASRGN